MKINRTASFYTRLNFYNFHLKKSILTFLSVVGCKVTLEKNDLTTVKIEASRIKMRVDHTKLYQFELMF